MKLFRKSIVRLWNLFSLVFVASSIFGISRAIYIILINRYIHYKVYHLIIGVFLDNIVDSIFYGFIIFLVILFVNIVLRFAVKNIFPRWVKNEDKYLAFGIATDITLVYFFYGGWIINRFWLPGFFTLKSYLGNLGILAVAFVLWASLFRIILKPERLNKLNFIWVNLLCFFVLGAVLLLCTYRGIQKVYFSPKGPNFILLSIDTLRADHLGCYGYSRNTSPHIDQFAQESILFKNCVSTSSWTLPSHVSMMTGLYPSSHGVLNTHYRLSDNVLTLAEILKENGYATAGFVSGYCLKPIFGFTQGFDIYRVQCTARRGRTSKKINESVIRWLRENSKEKFFIFVHYFDVHFDYVPPSPYNTLFDPDYRGSITGQDYYTKEMKIDRRDLEHIVALYDGEIRWVDFHIGKLLNEIKKIGLENQTVIILTSDHGDEFLDHGLKGHGNNLYETTIHVPLMIKTPSTKPLVKEDVVSSVDIVPTVLALAKIKTNLRWDGEDLTQFVDHGRAVLSELEHESFIYKRNTVSKSIRMGSQKMVIDLLKGSQEFYDLKNDPKEQKNLMGVDTFEYDETINKLSAIYIEWMKTHEGKEDIGTNLRLDDETKKQLKSLGYL